MENLNKENLFNQLTEKYPEAMNGFLFWIDEYKKSVAWSNLFNRKFKYLGEYTTLQGSFNDYEGVKFHDLPYEMQIGIFLKWVCEVMPAESTDLFREFYSKGFVDLFIETVGYVNSKPDMYLLQEKDLKDIKKKGIGHNG